ncbi:hypothetical protein E8E11_012006 [Didymella keratinophila]|nr:hypothetical protein E8E11_012006 [Didymella keratinophila]
MASFASSLRNLLGRGQPFTSSTPGPIARFDGMSETPQEMHRAISSEIGNTEAAATDNISTPPTIGQPEPGPRDYDHQPASSHRLGQPGQHSVVQQGGQQFDHIHDTVQPPQELGIGGFSQYDEWTRQVPSRTATVQPPENPQCGFHIDDQPFASQLPDTVSNAGAEAQVKQEAAMYEHDDRDVFAEFTNEDVHELVAQASEETQKVVESAYHAASGPPSMKQEPESESRPSAEAVAQNERIEFTVTPTMMMQQTQEVLTRSNPHSTHENAVTASRAGSERAHPQSQTSSTLATSIDSAQQQYSFEQYAQIPQQSIPHYQLQHSSSNILRSPSVDSVIGAQRHSSEETASSRSGMDLAANAQLFAQQWQQQRLKSLTIGGLTADAVHANPALLHGPVSTSNHGAPQPFRPSHPPQDLSLYRSIPAREQQRNSTFPYNANPLHSMDNLATHHGQTQPSWVIPSWSFDLMTPQAHPSANPGALLQGSVDSHRVTEVQEDDFSEASDDDEPLVTRAPRHRSTTASPMPASAPLSGGSTLSKTHAAAPKPIVMSIKQDSVIELSDDDDDEDAAATISWKLPDFEVTYHPPATDKDLPMAKVSILGAKENLVRREVSLTEDHAHHEMELFLNVFLPAQQALPTPDPEPVHAVINFHTISVMVLEAFVQYEIGDEMGRGYGFHGGNVDNQVLRPSPSSSDEEPTRTRSAKDADVDEIFFAVIDRWRAGLISCKGTLKLIRGCQEFCEIALDVIHYVKEHGLSQPEPKKRKERSDKGVKRGPQGGTKEAAAKGKATGKRKADAVEGKAPAKAKVNELTGRKKAKVEVTKSKPKLKAKSSGIIVIKK